MKLFILAALIAISSAARLEHLEQQRGLKEYLPPVQTGHHQSFGGHGSDFSQNGLDAGDSAGFGSAPQGVRAGSGSAGVRGVSSFEAARSNQYLPPDHGPSGNSGFNRPIGGAQGQDSFGASSNQFASASQFGQNNKFGSQGSSSFGSQGSSGFGTQGSSGVGSHGSGFGSHGSQGSFESQSSQGGFGSHGSQGGFGSHGSQGGFGSQGSQGSFGSQGSQGGFGSHGSQGGFGSQGSQGGFGSHGSQGGFGSQGSQGSFGSQGSNFGSQGSRGQQSQLRQYLAPKTSHDNIPQQAFNEQTGYLY